ncbi:MAG TPA: hypothetical protein PKD96_02045 [Candidatus Absconditabacterales bacterium]|nr:hypothetical protein [Candidatus Absconditabacterales bacterium]HMT27061.1 hypothetical protein [Candidatus Absconditabacterales bacterium]
MTEKFESHSQKQVPKVEMKGMKAENEQLKQEKAKEINEVISSTQIELGELEKQIKQKTTEENIDALEKAEASHY